MTYLKNPFNYTGAKFKLLPQLTPLFPKNIDTFYDIFGGSGEVVINSKANKYVYNEKNIAMANLMNVLSNKDTNYSFINNVDALIQKYNLSKTNKEGFMRLRTDFNTLTLSDYEKAVYFYTLLAHSFNNQYSFNSSYQFNTPFGMNRSSFNNNMRGNLEKYISVFNKKNIEILNYSFGDFNTQNFTNEDFVYIDPPYLISVGAYERDYHCKWSIDLERELLVFIDSLNDNGVKFGLSNVLTHKGKVNELLIEWSKKYNTHYIDKTYKNCNYQTHKNVGKSDEVYICNY